jgi:hypothetical protein
MPVTFHIGDQIDADSTDAVLDFVQEQVNNGADVNDLIASMLCCISAILEASDIEDDNVH